MGDKYRNSDTQSGPAITAQHVTINNYYAPPWMVHGLDDDTAREACTREAPADELATDPPKPAEESTDSNTGPGRRLEAILETVAGEAGNLKNPAALGFVRDLIAQVHTTRAKLQNAEPAARERLTAESAHAAAVQLAGGFSEMMATALERNGDHEGAAKFRERGAEMKKLADEVYVDAQTMRHTVEVGELLADLETNEEAGRKWLERACKAHPVTMRMSDRARDHVADGLVELARESGGGKITVTIEGKSKEVDGSPCTEYNSELCAKILDRPSSIIDRIQLAAVGDGTNVRTAEPGEDNHAAVAELMDRESGGTMTKEQASDELDQANARDCAEMTKVDALVLDTLELVNAETEQQATGMVVEAVRDHAAAVLGHAAISATLENEREAVDAAIGLIMESTPDGERYQVRDHVLRFAMITFTPVRAGVYRLEAESVQRAISATAHHVDGLQMRPLNIGAGSVDGARAILRALQLDADTLDPAGRDFRAYLMAAHKTTLTVSYADGSASHFGVEPGQPVIITTKNPAAPFDEPAAVIGRSWASPVEHCFRLPAALLSNLRDRATSAETARLAFNYEQSDRAKLRARYLTYLGDVWPFMMADTLADDGGFGEEFERLSKSGLSELNGHHYHPGLPARLIWLALPLCEWMDLAEALDELADGHETNVPRSFEPRNFFARIIATHESHRAREAQTWTPTANNSEPVRQAGGALQLDNVDNAAVPESEDREVRDHLEAIESVRGRWHWVAVLFRTTPTGMHDTAHRIAELERDAADKAANPFLVNWARLFAHRLRQQTHAAAMGPHAESYFDLFGVEHMANEAPAGSTVNEGSEIEPYIGADNQPEVSSDATGGTAHEEGDPDNSFDEPAPGEDRAEPSFDDSTDVSSAMPETTGGAGRLNDGATG